LYTCKIWSLILREEHRLKAFANRVLRRIFGPKMGEMLGGWRKLHIKEFHNLYSSPNNIKITKSRRIRWGTACSTHGENRNTCGVLMGNPEEKNSRKN
jgi:hypothetical protein